MIIRPLDPFSEVVDERRRWTPDWYGWLQDTTQQIGSWNNTSYFANSDYLLMNGDNHKTIALGGNVFYTLSIGAASSYDANFNVVIVNTDNYPGGRAKKIAIAGRPTSPPLLLWPGQGFFLYTAPISSTGTPDWQAIPSDPIPLRWEVPATANLFVNTATGNDDNDGLVSTTGGPLLTVQRAVNVVGSLWDIGARLVTINVVGAPVNGVVIEGPWVGTGVVQIQGDNVTPSNVTWHTVNDPCVLVRGAGRVVLKGFKVLSDNNSAVVADGAGSILINNKMEYGQSGLAHLQVGNYGAININSANADYIISGGAGSIPSTLGWHYLAQLGGSIQVDGRTMTLSASVLFGGSFAAANGGIILVGGNAGANYVNPANAGVTKKFAITGGGNINTNTAGNVNFFPGSTAGTPGAPLTGGFYA